MADRAFLSRRTCNKPQISKTVRLHGITIKGFQTYAKINETKVSPPGDSCHACHVTAPRRVHLLTVLGCGCPQLYDCARNGLFVYDGGEALITKSEIFNSAECNGCQVKGEGSKLAIHDCKVYNNTLSAVYCMAGGTLEMMECQVRHRVHPLTCR